MVVVVLTKNAGEYLRLSTVYHVWLLTTDHEEYQRTPLSNVPDSPTGIGQIYETPV